MSNSNSRLAEVAVPLHVAQTFTYRLTPEQSIDAKPGARIIVPFGRKLLTGYIVALHEKLPANIPLTEAEIKEAKSLVDRVPVCTEEILQLALWVSEYYACPIGEVIKAALPPGMKPKLRRFVRATDLQPEKITDKQQSVLDTLKQHGTMPLQELSAAVVSALEKKGLVEIFDGARQYNQ